MAVVCVLLMCLFCFVCLLFVPRLLCVACCLRVDVRVCSLLRFPRSVCYGVVVCCRCWIVVRAGVVCCIIIADVVRVCSAVFWLVVRCVLLVVRCRCVWLIVRALLFCCCCVLILVGCC